MGAERFEEIGYGSSAEKAFKELVERACYNYGHAGYTGTIAEKTECRCYSNRIYKVSSTQEIYDLVEKFIGDPKVEDKWGPAWYVQFEDDKGSGYVFFGYAAC